MIKKFICLGFSVLLGNIIISCFNDFDNYYSVQFANVPIY